MIRSGRKAIKMDTEERRLEKERRKKQFKRKLEAKLQPTTLAAQLELERLQLKRARVERENVEARAEVHSAASSQAGQENVAAVTETCGLSSFVDGKDNLDNYL